MTETLKNVMMTPGATPCRAGGVRFCVWAPNVKKLSLKLLAGNAVSFHALEKNDQGYFAGAVASARPGDDYLYVLDERLERPDPASRFQPYGVHGPSRIVDTGLFAWDDGDWKGPSLSASIIYELHAGTFSPEGTFDGVISLLPHLVELGVTAVELMPVAQFPGKRNWGYDGTYPFAPQNSYGGPEGLNALVNECHKRGLAVILDVVYNHLGPEGNYLRDFGPYFTNRYRSFWGDAINFDGPESDHVRDFFVGNALYWITEYHIDALRLDAIHGIWDFGARHILQELKERVGDRANALGREVHLIAESDLNDVRFVTPIDQGGCGVDAQWNDDFHHALHTLLTGEAKGYYKDFGTIGHLKKAFAEGFVYSGQFSAYRRRRHGSSSIRLKPHQFVVFSQNHDQVGNRPAGDRLAATQDLETLKLAAATVLLSPYIPLLFMGEEYGETAPFQYFIDHSDPDLLRAVKEGRIEEFASFEWGQKVPDPGAEETFRASRINVGSRAEGRHKTLFGFYKHIILLRTTLLASVRSGTFSVGAWEGTKVLWTESRDGGRRICSMHNYDESAVDVLFEAPAGTWNVVLDSSSSDWGGPGSHLAGTIVSPGPVTINRRSFVLLEFNQEGGVALNDAPVMLSGKKL